MKIASLLQLSNRALLKGSSLENEIISEMTATFPGLIKNIKAIRARMSNGASPPTPNQGKPS